MVKHLWECQHSYYCNEGNYFNNDCGTHYKSWSDFMGEMSDADTDYNLLFRWDWLEGEDHDLQPFNGDNYYRNGKLLLFWMQQRKGIYAYSYVEVCRADEDEVIKFLKPRLEHLKGIWEPLA